MNIGIVIWIFYFVIGLPMVILPLAEAILSSEICDTLINLQIWLYIQSATQLALYLAILPYCLEIYFYNFTEQKFQYPRSIFRLSCLATIILSLFAIGWAGIGIHERYTCPISKTTSIILASSAMNFSIYIIGTFIVSFVLYLDISSHGF